MRIQHNIPAMSSYRNYTNNTSALAKNLEKLSSGYKINRAGDDAAGLAISEKMRAQITGLEVAQKNAKDGISLVQTAEGALTEVHDMLNRMYELAEQSANGTYQDQVDREQLDKEVQKLKEEIDRISKASNFNGIKLLDGTQAAGGASGTTISGTDRMLQTVFSTGLAADKAGSETILDGGKDVTATKTKFSIDLTGLSATVKGVAKDQTAKQLDITINVGGVDYALSFAGSISTDSNVAADKSITSGTILTALITKMGGAGKSVTLGGVAYVIQADNSFEMKNDPTSSTDVSANIGISVKEGTKKDGTIKGSQTVGVQVTPGAVASSATRANTVFKIEASDLVDGTTITLGNKTVTLAVGKNTKQDTTQGTVVDLTEFEAGSVDLNVALGKIQNTIGTSVTDANAKDANGQAVANVTLNVGVSNKGNSAEGIGLTVQRTDGVDKNVYNTKEDLGKIFSITVPPATSGSSSGLKLQIGDDASDYNQMIINIKKCDSAAIGIGSIDVLTQDNATSAMNAVKSAINYVSDVRGELGAAQNRLDHTINNLSVMQQNIQDAESTIRDVDVAQEMMEYTKNNILVQSAQAMLAQANQMPQGVLQLLQ